MPASSVSALPRETRREPSAISEDLKVGYDPSRSRPRTGEADPDARKKLLWVALVVLVLVVAVILGALRPR